MYFLISKKTTFFDNFLQVGSGKPKQAGLTWFCAAGHDMASPGALILQFVAIDWVCLCNKLNLCA